MQLGFKKKNMVYNFEDTHIKPTMIENINIEKVANRFIGIKARIIAHKKSTKSNKKASDLLTPNHNSEIKEINAAHNSTNFNMT